jgi:hypothetical protein|tara:strand:- start:897 stop:1322 length:426 start_codon:yes stop_codon:yes gene_type:complete
MAYLIFNSDNNLVKIAANDSDRDSQNIVLSNHSVVSVSDADFLKVKTGSSATYDGTSVTIVEQDALFNNFSNLQIHFDNVIKSIKEFSKNNASNSLYTNLNNYKEYLETFDSSSVSFPLNKTWEKYCDENSITFYHPLQIP